MPVTLSHQQDNIYRLTITGILSKADLDRSQEALVADLGREPGAVRLLVVLDGFEGWDSRGAWNDLTFFVRHGDRLEKIAIVGEPRWHDHALMFAAADLRKAPVEFFATEALSDASAWLAR